MSEYESNHMNNFLLTIGELIYRFLNVNLGIIILPSHLLGAVFDYLDGCFLGFLFSSLFGWKKFCNCSSTIIDSETVVSISRQDGNVYLHVIGGNLHALHVGLCLM